MFFRTLNTVFKTILIYVPCLLVFSHFPHFCPAADFSLFFFSLYLNVSFACLPLLQSAKVTSHAQLSSIRLYYKHPDILLK